MNAAAINLVLLILMFFINCTNFETQNSFHPMVDGDKMDWLELKVNPIKISEETNLYIYQNKSYIWLAYDYPDGSYGTLDMIIETDKIKHPINIHVSAQLGEWKVGDEQNIPQEATSELWWNNKAWIANNLWANGIDTVTYNTPELKIRNGQIREIQLSKKRFGFGEWKIKLNINAIKNSEGSFINLQFPDNDDYYIINATQ